MKRIYMVNGVTSKITDAVNDIGGLRMAFVASSEAKAIGMAMKELKRQDLGRSIASIFAQDITTWAQQALASIEEKP